MDKIFPYLVNGTFSMMKGPLLSLLMMCIIVSLARHPPGRLFEADGRFGKVLR